MAARGKPGTGGPGPLQHPAAVIDASVWASRLMPQDSNHAASVQWMRRYADASGLLVAPAFLLVEVSAAVTRQTGQTASGKQAVSYILCISQMRLVPLDAALIQSSADMAADLHLRAGDAVYVTVAYLMSIPLVSWDKEQIRRAAGRVAGFAPDNFSL